MNIRNLGENPQLLIHAFGLGDTLGYIEWLIVIGIGMIFGAGIYVYVRRRRAVEGGSVE